MILVILASSGTPTPVTFTLVYTADYNCIFVGAVTVPITGEHDGAGVGALDCGIEIGSARHRSVEVAFYSSGY